MNTIRRYRSAAEAAIARTVLASAGIDAVLADEGVAQLGPQFAPWGIRLQVPDEDAQRAVEILDRQADADPAETEVADVLPDAGAPREYEVGSPRTPAESGDPGVICPGCGAEWEWSGAELDRSGFTCTDCGTAIPLEGRGLDWRMFLPRSKSMWIFVLVMVAYTFLLGTIWSAITAPFLPQYPPWNYAAYGWPTTLTRVGVGVIVTPIWETLLLGGIIGLLRFMRVPALIAAFFAALALCAVDGYRYWQHGVEVLPGFAIMALTYLYWRRTSWGHAFLAVLAVHSFHNATLYTREVMNQIHLDAVSYRTTGSPFKMDDAQQLYREGVQFSDAGKPVQAIDALQKAISIYPRNAYYWFFAVFDGLGW